MRNHKRAYIDGARSKKKYITPQVYSIGSNDASDKAYTELCQPGGSAYQPSGTCGWVTCEYGSTPYITA